jgi:antitoxin (DNA-binding transcriptional repressor) of toxin-antitoxin stability system
MSKKGMREVTVTEFKTSCSALLNEVSKTKIGLRITKRGRIIADVIPLLPEKPVGSWLGHMAGTAKIIGDILEPEFDVRKIDALRAK